MLINEHSDNDLNDIGTNDDADNVVTPDGEDVEENKELELDEQETETNKKQSNGSLTPGQMMAQKQEDVWFNRILSGTAELEDPKLPSWLKPRVESRIKRELGDNSMTSQEFDINKMKEELKAEIREESEFTALKKSLPKLTKLELAQLRETYQKYKPIGKLEALRTAITIMGIAPEKSGMEQVRRNMSLPSGSQPTKRERVSGNPLEALSKDPEKWKKWEKAGFQVDPSGKPVY